MKKHGSVLKSMQHEAIETEVNSFSTNLKDKAYNSP